MCEEVRNGNANETRTMPNNWFEELTDLENRTADAIMRLKVVKAALDGILPDMVHRPEYDMMAGCGELIGEAVETLEKR